MFKNLKLLIAGSEFHICFRVVNSRITWPNAHSLSHLAQSILPKVRIMLAEKKLDFAMEVEPVWERRTEFLALNPAGEVPVLVEPDNTVLSDSSAICEYTQEQSPEPNLMGGTL